MMYFSNDVQLIFSTFLIYFVTYTHCIMFHLQPKMQKCLREELEKDVLIKGEYEVSEAINQRVDYVVTDSKGHIFSQKDDVRKGMFTFVSEEKDTFEICFFSKIMQKQESVNHEIKLIVKTGVEAKSYDEIGKTYQLKPMELELKRLEDLSQSIIEDFAYMRIREEQMRNTNESTNNRVFYLSMFSVFIILALPTWQIFYLRRYFRSKKLIE